MDKSTHKKYKNKKGFVPTPKTIEKKTYPLHKIVQYGNFEKFKVMLNKRFNEVNDQGYPLLVLACVHYNYQILELLLECKNINPHLTNNEGFNALHCLAFDGRLFFIKKLFEKFPDLKIDELTKQEDTALILATKRNNAEVIKYLHKKGADIEIKNGKGYTALHCAADNGYIESTKQLIAIGANINTRDFHGSTPMMKAIHWGFSEIGKLLMGGTIDFQERDYLLHEALECHNIEKTKILLPIIKDVNQKNNKGDPILVLACQLGNKEIMDLILDCKNIDPYVTNKDQFNALHMLAFKGNLDIIQKLFQRFPNLEVDRVTDKENTALVLAAKMDHSDVIEYLHSKGANVNHKNNKEFTALAYAANNGYVKSTLKLLQLGANVNVKDNYGFTPLMKASSWGFIEVCEILLKNKANIELKSIKGLTAIIEATRRGNSDTVKLLLNHKANTNS